jgi:hypothetical protein
MPPINTTPAIIKIIIMLMETSKAIEGKLNICAYIPE